MISVADLDSQEAGLGCATGTDQPTMAHLIAERQRRLISTRPGQPAKCLVTYFYTYVQLTPNCINWLVASSTNANNVHMSPRASNHACSEPSICTNSPRHSRRRRG